MAIAKAKRGRKPTGPTTVIVRIPGALKPAVTELVAHYRQAKLKAWEAAPLKQPVAPPETETTDACYQPEPGFTFEQIAEWGAK